MFELVKVVLRLLFRKQSEQDLVLENADLRLRLKAVSGVCGKFKDPNLYHGECYFAFGVDSLITQIKGLAKLCR